MHIQQTKVESRATGGPQYYLRNELEKITCAAVRLADGTIFTGFAHGYALEKAWAAHKKTLESVCHKLFDKLKDGFMTNKGRFVGRKMAYNLAVKNHQMTRTGYSQAAKDLWGCNIETSNELGALSFNNARNNNEQEKNMDAKDNAVEEKTKVWRLLDKILGQTERVVNHRPDWKIHRETDTSIIVTFSKDGQLFYDVSKKDLDQFAAHRRAFFVFLAGSHKDALIVPSQKLHGQIKAHGLSPSQEYGDYKLHLVQSRQEAYFREMPSFDLAEFFNQYAQLL